MKTRHFWADATSPIMGQYAAGCSPDWGSGGWQAANSVLLAFSAQARAQHDDNPQPNDKKAVSAHTGLVNLLLEDGWEPVTSRGRAWWQHNFRRLVRSPEAGWLVLMSKPEGETRWVWDEIDEDGPPEWLDQAVRDGKARREGKRFRITEACAVEVASNMGLELVSHIQAYSDGHHILTFRVSDDTEE